MEHLYQSEDQSAVIVYDEKGNFLEQTLKGRVSDSVFKRVNKKLDKYISQTGCRKIVYNFEQLEHSDIISRAWHASVFTPELFQKHGLKFTTAVVNCKNTFEKKNAELLFQHSLKLGQKGDVKYFENVKEAESWISRAM